MKFDEYVAHAENYNAEIRTQGDLPWFEDARRRAKVAAQLGLPANSPAQEVRQALFERGRK